MLNLKKRKVVKFAKLPSTKMLVLITVILTLALTTYYLVPLDRSIFISARTQVMSLVFADAEKNYWQLENTTLCAPKRERASQLDSANVLRPDALCGDEERLGAAAFNLNFTQGTRILVVRTNSNQAVISIEKVPQIVGSISTRGESASKEFPMRVGMRFLVSTQNAANGEALPFDAEVVVGRQGFERSVPVLLTGAYELRETLLFRDRPELVGSGNLQMGDVISVKSKARDHAAMSGILLFENDNPAAMRVAMSVGAEATESLKLQLVRWGFGTTDIEPSWSGRALADQFTYALVILLTLMGALLAALAHIKDLFLAPETAATAPETTNGESVADLRAKVEFEADTGEEKHPNSKEKVSKKMSRRQ